MAEAAAATARKTFEDKELAESLPTVDVPGAEFEAGFGALSAFVRAGLVASTGEARRQIRGGGLRINDATLGDEKALITREELKAGGIVKLSLGRKKHVLLRAV
jgi:tyrosyl-tRNA synthetase